MLIHRARCWRIGRQSNAVGLVRGMRAGARDDALSLLPRKFQSLARIAERSLAFSVLGRVIIDLYVGSNTPQPDGAPGRAATEWWQAGRTSACRIHPHRFANGNIPFKATGHLGGL